MSPRPANGGRSKRVSSNPDARYRFRNFSNGLSIRHPAARPEAARAERDGTGALNGGALLLRKGCHGGDFRGCKYAVEVINDVLGRPQVAQALVDRQTKDGAGAEARIQRSVHPGDAAPILFRDHRDGMGSGRLPDYLGPRSPRARPSRAAVDAAGTVAGQRCHVRLAGSLKKASVLSLITWPRTKAIWSATGPNRRGVLKMPIAQSRRPQVRLRIAPASHAWKSHTRKQYDPSKIVEHGGANPHVAIMGLGMLDLREI